VILPDDNQHLHKGLLDLTPTGREKERYEYTPEFKVEAVALAEKREKPDSGGCGPERKYAASLGTAGRGNGGERLEAISRPRENIFAYILLILYSIHFFNSLQNFFSSINIWHIRLIYVPP
jgi:hypothetical protein